jgi:hypothetical protein
MKPNTTTTMSGKVAKGRKTAFPQGSAGLRQLPHPRAEIAAVVEKLTKRVYGHDYLSEVARGRRTNLPLKKAIEKAVEILDARHKEAN